MQKWTKRLSVAFCAAALHLGGVARAQEDELRPCEEACFDAEDRCYETCESSDDSATCTSTCQEESDRCLQKCE
jgi:hypothetical protein